MAVSSMKIYLVYMLTYPMSLLFKAAQESDHGYNYLILNTLLDKAKKVLLRSRAQQVLRIF